MPGWLSRKRFQSAQVDETQENAARQGTTAAPAA
jgi:hypothetical protein